MKILVTGKGGREHAIVTALRESGDHHLYVYPGSDAISQIATKVEVNNLDELISWMKQEQIDLCVAGEESYLVLGEGLANLCLKHEIPCWGPVKEAAQLEASKAFAKEFMQRHHIPTADFKICTTAAEARESIKSVPIVLKFDGLAAGKGVAVCSSREEAYDFIDEVMEKRVFGAGNLIVESCLTGPEVSVFVSIVDDQYQILMAARDYKRIFDADQGPNTGGMGAVASRELIDSSILKQIEDKMIVPTVKGLQKDGLSYRGFLYFGVMLTPDGPQMLEYNCRFGDPEAEAVMPMIRGSLPDYLKSAAQGKLNQQSIQFTEGWSVCVILASAGYPASSRNGDEIKGIPENTDLTRVYHCGTRWNKDKNCFETQGGRVLAAVASGNMRQEARDRAYAINQQISFAGQQMRTDIATLHFD